MSPRHAIISLVCSAGLVHGSAFSQPETKPAPPPPQSPPAQPTSPGHEPTLDELLGLPNSKPATPKPGEQPSDSAGEAKPAPIDPAKAELERQLSPTEVTEAFEQAVTLMGQTADRLDASHDTGVETQRMQEDVIRKLDTLIDQAKKQQSKSKSKSKPKDQSQKSQQQQQSSQQNSKTNDPQKGGGPDLQNGATHVSPGGTAVWGNLPEHVRNALFEGTSERFSSMYKSVTEKYYKRLAEEPKAGSVPPPSVVPPPTAGPGTNP